MSRIKLIIIQNQILIESTSTKKPMISKRNFVSFIFYLTILPIVSYSYTRNYGTGTPTDDPSPAKSMVASKRSFKALESYSPQSAKNFYLEDYITPVTSQEEELRNKIEATYQKVLEENRFIDFLDENSLLELPVGIKKDIGVLQYTILIDSVIMTPRESFLYASMRFQAPQFDRPIHFMGRDIKFSRTGGLTGDGIVTLVGDYPLTKDGGKAQLILKGSDPYNNTLKTYAEFDCNGFKQLTIDASLLFSRELLVPEGTNGEQAPTGNVTVDFRLTVADWSDIMVAVNIPSFQVTTLKGVTFSVTDAVLDFSDTQNPPAIVFPSGYAQTSPLMAAGNQNLWQGVFIRNLTVTLPPQFETKNEAGERTPGTGHRVSFEGRNLIIDNVGFSGHVSANNLIPLNKGKIGNWAFSLEEIHISVVANEIREGGFSGLVNIPINKTDMAQGEQASANAARPFTYKAIIKAGNEYLFTVSNSERLNFELWKADVTLKPSSYVEIKLIDGKFRPKAHLNGQMTMNIGLKDGGEVSGDNNKNAKVANITFEGLEIQTVKPYVKVGRFSLGAEGGNSGMGGFPIRINEISGASSGNEISLSVDVTLSLIGESDGGFAANGKFKIISEGNDQGDYLSYRFKKIELQRFGIDIDKGSFKFKGTLNFYKEDPVYGNGISGTVDATFQPTFQLQASAIFGSRNGVRYWFVDALASFESGIPIFSGVAIYSFGGGAYYHMKMDTEGVGSPLGKTVSGIVYVPDERTGFGFKATIGFGIQPGKKAFNADITYEMAFNTGGGVKYINFRGNGYFMTNPVPTNLGKLQETAKKLAAVQKKLGNGNLNESSSAAEELYGSPQAAGARAQVWASVMIHFDFDNNSLHGNLKAYVNVAGGLLQGGGANGLAGEAVLHFAPGEWYIYIGRPEYENRFALKVLGIATLDAYFVIGTKIPGSPPPPSNVSSILGDIDLDYMKELNALGDGAGVGFGASFRVDTGDITFLMFYGRFAAGLGFDIMLKNYGDAECVGEGPLGINGWYANGQAYAYFEGKIGIRVKVFRRTKKINILEIGAAVVAQAKLPNPTWVRGIAGGYFSVLGGLVKGKCSFEIEIGKECKIKGASILESIEVLAQTTPTDGSQDVDVFVVPQAVFNYELEKEYELFDDVNNELVKFKISLDEFTVKQNGTPLTADIRWNGDKTVAALNPFDILPPNQDLILEVALSFKEKRGGIWQVAVSEGENLVERHTVRFKTGTAPDHIPPDNVAYSYPQVNQFNYYKNEYTQGYITLKRGQPYLFEASTEWSQIIRLEVNGGQRIEIPVSYVTNARELRMTMPQNLLNDRIYKISVMNVPRGTLSVVDANIRTATATVSGNDPENELTVKTKQAEGTIKEGQEKELYATYFRTSRYNTFREKIVSADPSTGWRDPISAGVHLIGSNIGGPEPFSYDEIYGSAERPALIQMEADLSGNSWYQNSVYPIVYADYPIMGKFTLTNRDPNVLGIVPKKAVFVYQYPWDIKITESETAAGTAPIPSTVGRIDYYLAYYMHQDWFDLGSQLAKYADGHVPTARMNKLLGSTFPAITKGDYWLNINYMLPGKQPSSTYRHKIFNPVD